MSKEVESSTAFYVLPETISQYHPELTQEIIEQLNAFNVNIFEFGGRRTNSGDYLLTVPERDTNAVIFATHAEYMGNFSNEMLVQLHALTHPWSAINGTIICIFPYLEGRDDAKFIDKQAGMLDFNFRVLRAFAPYHEINGFCIWDPHSSIVVEALKHFYFPQFLVESGARQSFEIPCDEAEIPVIPLTAVRLFADRIKERNLVNGNTVVLAPDLGALSRSQIFASELQVPLYLTEKKRDPKTGELSVEGFYSIDDHSISELNLEELKGKQVVIFDDMLDSGGTAVKVAQKLKQEFGVSYLIFAATHGLFTKPEIIIDALVNNYIDLLLVSNSLPTYKIVSEADTIKILNITKGYPVVDVVSIAQTTAALIAKLTGLKSTEIDANVARALYNPGPPKFKMKKLFEQGVFPLQ